MHTRFLHVLTLAAAALAAPAPQPPPYGPSAGFSLQPTGSFTRPFQSPTLRTSAPPKSSATTNIVATSTNPSKTTPFPTVSSGSGNSTATAIFSIINKLGSPVSTSYIANQTPISGPGGPGVLKNNETAVLTVALNWSGNIAMSEGTPSGDDSLFEATFAPNGLDVDVSYV